jgi:hypothetical protein
LEAIAFGRPGESIGWNFNREVRKMIQESFVIRAMQSYSSRNVKMIALLEVRRTTIFAILWHDFDSNFYDAMTSKNPQFLNAC